MKKSEQCMIAYSDEAVSDCKRYRCIAIVSGRSELLEQLRRDLGKVLEESRTDHVEWKEVRGHASKTKAAKGYISKAVEYAAKGHIRIDVLIWDTQDKRHAIVGRDDLENLHRMYYKLLVHIGRRWSHFDWILHSDERGDMDWQKIRDFVNRTRVQPKQKGQEMPTLLKFFDEFRQKGKRRFNLEVADSVNSEKEPLIQLADLFAGMAWYSRKFGSEIVEWLKNHEQADQHSLIESEVCEQKELKKQEQVRFELIAHLGELCKRHKLGVSLRERRHLWTPEPDNPINFWNYEPQHEADKAPKRKKRGE